MHTKKKLTTRLLALLMTALLMLGLALPAGLLGSTAKAASGDIVTTEAALRSAVSDAPTTAPGNVTPYVIELGSDITLTGTGTTAQLSIPPNKNITLTGGYTLTQNTNSQSAINVSGGTLTLDGPTVTHAAGSRGSGVSVNSGGTFNLVSGTIRDNTTYVNNNGGGVYVYGSGTFNMSGGTITGNTADYYGGVCVYVTTSSATATFTMTGGTIMGNTTSQYGGGVCVYVTNNGSATFTMSGGTITGNTTSRYGGGGVSNGGTFTMSGGEISGNTAGTYGGGVTTSGTFTMSGGEISGNKANTNGGGVYASGTFNMSDSAVISGNTAGTNGGGIYTTNYTNLTVGADVTISGNSAATKATVVTQADAATYAAKISLPDTAWTLSPPDAPSDAVGYNNYDINYVNYTVTFDAQDGTPTPDTQYVLPGGTATKPDDPTYVSHTFGGWYTAANGPDGTGTLYNFGTAVNSDLTLYAYWTYTLTYNANGGVVTGVDGAGETAKVTGLPAGEHNLNDVVPSHAPATVDGGTLPVLFVGWTLDSSATGILSKGGTVPKLVTAVDISGNTTVYAVWSYDENGNNTGPDVLEDTYSLSYDANGGTGGPETVTGLLAQDGYTLSKTAPGHAQDNGKDVVFIGWTAEQATKIYAAADTAPTTITTVDISGNTTVYAVYGYDENQNRIADVLETKYDLTYNLNGGTDGTGPNPERLLAQTGYTLSTTAPSHAQGNGKDVVFIGWTETLDSTIYAASDTAPATITTVDISGNTTVYAVYGYDENKNGTADVLEDLYHVHYIANGADSGSVPVDDYPYAAGATLGTVLDNTGELERTGYAFNGWNTAPDGSGTGYAAGDPITVTRDVDLYAQWTAKPCDVLFYDSNPATGTRGTQIGETMQVDYDTQIGADKVVPNPTAPTGYVFVGWRADDDNGGGVYDSTAVANYVMNNVDGVTFTAVYADAAKATVIFDYAGGTGGTKNYFIGKSGTDFTAPANPTKTGYTFNGWTLNDAAATPVGTFGDPGSVTVYVAQWTANKYTATFKDYDNATLGTVTELTYGQTVSEGSDYTVADPTPDTGYTFTSWLSSNGGLYTSDEAAAYIVTGDVIFTAQYAPIANATVIFDYAGGVDGSGKTSSSDSNLPDTPFTAPVPTREGYTLTGWSLALAEDSENPGTYTGTFGAAGSVTTYVAQWTATNYTATFKDYDNATLGTVTELTYGHAVSEGSGSVPADPTREAYTFTGWSDGTSIYPSSAIPDYVVTGDVTFTAQYTPIADATVVFDYAGGMDGTGATSSSDSGQPGETYTTPTLARDGYDFNGWTPETPSGTFGTAGSVTTYVAQWTANKYTVTFLPGDHGTMSPDPATEDVAYSENVTSVPTITADTGYTFIGWSDGNGLYDSAAVLSYPVTATVTFTAQYADAQNATVIFDYNGGTDGSGNTSSYVSNRPGTTYDVPDTDAITKTGYTFAGWTPETPSGTFGAAGSVTTYVANWTPIEYTATFNNADDTVIGTVSGLIYGQTVSEGSGYTVADPTPDTGYTFTGWLSSNGGLYTSDEAAAYIVTGDVTFTAQYTPIADATVVFDYAGGVDGTGKTSSSDSGQPGETYTTPTLARDGYDFNGWAPETPSGTFGAAGSVTTYVAQWTASEYTVTFLPGDHGTMSPDPATEDVAYSENVTSVPAITADTGYTFIGWSDGTSIYPDNDAVAAYIVTGDVTFTAQYADAQNATVIFDYAGGSGDMPNYFIGKSGADLTVPADPTMTGYTFDGWTLNGAAATPDSTFGDPGSVTVYTAQWTPKQYTVTFEQGSSGTLATNPTEIDAAYGETITGIPAVTPESGYTFIGWSDSSKLYGDSAMAAYSVTGDVAFTAQYLPIPQITVTFNYNGGTDTDGNSFVTLQGYPDAALTAPAPTRTGYDFNGWNTTPAATFGGAAGSVTTYVAQWTPKQYTVTFEQGANGTMNPATHSETVNYGNSVTSVPTITANSSYTFLGWSMNGGSTYYSSADVAAMRITGDTTFTAMYQLTTVTGGGGTPPVTPPATPPVTPPVTPPATPPVTPPLLTDAHIWYIRGYTDGTVRPDGNITRAEVSMAIYRLLKDDLKAGTASAKFSDVGANDWYGAAIDTLAQLNILKGYTDGTFRPNQPITRAELAAMLSRFFDLPAGAAQFPDVPSGYWASDAISRAATAGWFVGYPDGTFRPADNTTRAEFVTAMNRVLNRKLAAADIDPSLNVYTDLSASYWAYADIIEASYSHDYTRQDSGYETWTAVTGSGSNAAYNQ